MKVISFRSPMGQTIVLGLIFFFTFTAYLTIQALSADLYGEKLGSYVPFSIYGFFTVFCFVSPAITNKLGCKNAMFFGVLGYACLVLASLVYFLDRENHPNSETYQSVVLIGASLLGVGAALLWTGQGRLILQYSDGSDGGTLFSVFWMLFNMAALVGGVLTFFIFGNSDVSDDDGTASDAPTANSTLFIIFLAFVLCGACATRFILDATELERDNKGHSNNIFNNHNSNNALPLLVGDKNGLQPLFEVEVSESDWVTEFVETIKLFGTSRMAVLAILFLYTGYNQPYQLVTFGNRFFTSQTLGLGMIVFYGAEIVGGLWIGQFLDKAGKDKAKQREASKICLWIFFLVTSVSFVICFFLELPCAFKDKTCVKKISYDSVDVIMPTITYALWGFSDSQIQTYSYWLMGVLYESGEEQARAVGFYKMVQSLGWMVGFAFMPHDMMEPIIQLGGTVICFLVGLVLCLKELPSVKRG